MNSQEEEKAIPFELNEGENACQVHDYPDYYITNQGRLYSNKQKKFISHENKKNHYIQATLLPPKSNHQAVKRNAYVHELVLEHFLSNKPSDEFECDHIDGNTKNNNINNLQWLNHRDNLLKRKPYTKDRKPRLTKNDMNNFNRLFIDNHERLANVSNEKVAKLYKSESNVDINLQTVRINRNHWEIDDDNNLRKV